MIKYITEQIINETSNQEKITCQCGISTTGVDKKYEKFVGIPNFSFPSHVDNTIGYAKYYENNINN